MEENKEITTAPESQETASDQPKKIDPAAEAKSKILFLVIVIILMVAIKFIFKL